MTSRVGRTTLILVVVLVVAGVAYLSMNRVPAQTPSATTGSLPRTADGKPDLSGIWQVLNTAAWNIQDHSAAKGVPAGQGVVEGNELPYLPEALAKRNENFKNRLTADEAQRSAAQRPERGASALRLGGNALPVGWAGA